MQRAANLAATNDRLPLPENAEMIAKMKIEIGYIGVTVLATNSAASGVRKLLVDVEECVKVAQDNSWYGKAYCQSRNVVS